ncbi:transport protein Sec24-like [Pyrus ussuriensis x Pyrus communis]|uniref:Transport protein Sec24-like n=1 Tax=Pyrus ussuriensis x Pyrus communis TaxID=2448454 RepID=A0A5N5GW12_9ROSA|nr:transport protein Sec24-like [Pyrus ussuriensis x Pyrus communis]
MQNLNLNRQPSMPNSAPRPSPFGQAPPFHSSAPPAGAPVAPPPFSRPGRLPAALARPTAPQSGPPATHIIPCHHPSKTASWIIPPVGGVAPASGPPTGPFQTSGLPSGPVSVPPPASGPRPGPRSFPLGSGQSMPPTTAPGRLMSNGPPMFGSGAMLSGPRFPTSGNVPQPPFGHPPAAATATGPPRTPSMHSMLGSPAVTAPPGPVQQAPLGSPHGSQTWPMQQGHLAPPSQFPGSGQSPRMFGMPPTPLPNQSMATISPAVGQTGSPLTGSSKIDPNQIPRPVPGSSVLIHETRQGNQANPPPPATSDYIVRDNGNCSPRYMRCTINQIPFTADLLTTSGMPLALLVEPLALPHPDEEPIQVTCYINPFMKFVDQGRKFICNLCGFTDETPRDYHCNLGPDGRRRDADERPELCRGTVEFVASKEYMVRDPMPAVYFFLIDVSMNAIQTGATAAACSAISQVIADLPEGPRTMVGIATFDETIHFYNLKRALQQPLMLIVPDVQDVYTPLETDVIIHIPIMFQNSKTAESAFGAAIKAAFLAMKSTGGKLLVFQSVLASTGIGALSAREAEGRANISSAEKEAHKLLQPADKTLKKMAIELAEFQVCVNLFITTQSYIDIASISVIPRTTGGQVYYYHPFSAVSDPAKLYNDLRWNVTRPQGLEGVMRVRCSQGIQVQEYHGSFCKRIPTDVDVPGIDCDKTVMVTLKHDDKLQDGSECVTTLSLPCTSMLNNLFRAADLDTQFACFMKQAANEIASSALLCVREQVTNLCISSLLSYRKFCATVSSSGQLILPEALKLLPLYTLALIKSTGLRSDGKIDERPFWINHVSSPSVPLAVPLVYPRMVAIHDLESKKEGDESLIPPVIPLSSEHVSDKGSYLLENGEDCLIYIGNLVDPGILQQLFGITSADGLPTQFVLQQYDNPLSKKLNGVVNEIRRQRCSYLRYDIIFHW